MKTIFVICSLTILLAFGCESKTSVRQSQKKVKNSNYISPDTIYKISASRTASIDWDSLPEIKARIWKTKAVSTTLEPMVTISAINYQTSTIEVDTSKRAGFSLIDIKRASTSIKIPKTGYLVQNEDTIYAPEKVIVGKPRTKKVNMATRYNAIRNIQYLDIQQGLPNTYVTDGLIDSREHLWFGTNGGGALRFDGNLISTFSQDEGLNSSYINFIYEDSKGNIWIGTHESGMVKYDGTYFWYYGTKQGFKTGYYSMLEDSQNNLWFGSSKGLYMLQPEKEGNDYQNVVVHKNIMNLENMMVNDIVEDENGTIWVGTESGLFSIDKSGMTKHEMNFDNVTALALDKEILWVADQKTGFAKYDEKTITYFRDPTNLGNNNITTLTVDKKGHLNIGTYNEGLIIYDGKEYSSFNSLNGLSSNRIKKIFEDNSGNKWICTYLGGFSKIGWSSFNIIPRRTYGIDNRIISINEDLNKNIWLGGSKSSIYCSKNGIWKKILLNNSETEDEISNIAFDHQNHMWLSSFRNSTVSMYDGDSFINYELFRKSQHNPTYDIKVDRKNNIWFSSFGQGIIRYDGEIFRFLSLEDQEWGSYIYKIVEDTDGSLFLLGYENIYVIYENTLYKFKTDKRFVSGSCLNKGGGIWFGSNKGPVNLFFDTNEKTIKYISYDNATRQKIGPISTIGQSENGDIWLGSESKGIHILKASYDKDHSYQIKTISSKDGYNGGGIVPGSGYMDTDYNLWLASQNGIASMDTRAYTFTNSLPKPFLEAVSVNGELLEKRNLYKQETATSMGISNSSFKPSSVVKPFFNIPERLELVSDSDHLTFDFGAIDWQSFHNLQFQYRMEGYDSRWSAPTENTVAEYRNIPSGKYIFKVRSAAESGIWSEPALFEFTILPSRWLTWWAYLLYFFVGIIGFWLFVRLRTKAVREETESRYELKLLKQIMLEEGRHQEKARLAKELHDGLLGSLFGIRLSLDRLNQSEEDPQKVEREKYIQKLSDLEKEVRSLSHGLSPHIAIADLAFSQVIQNLLDEFSTIHDLSCSLASDSSISWEKISANIKFNLYRVVQESLQNVIKHSKASTIDIYFTKNMECIELLIADDGIGFPNKKYSKGIGLKNITSRIKRLSGSVKFENNEMQGANVIVSVPIE